MTPRLEIEYCAALRLIWISVTVIVHDRRLSRKYHPLLKYLQLERSSAILLHRPAHLYYDGLLHITANAANSGAISTAQDSRQTQLGLIYCFWAKGDRRVERITKETIVSATGIACRFHRRGLLCLVAR